MPKAVISSALALSCVTSNEQIAHQKQIDTLRNPDGILNKSGLAKTTLNKPLHNRPGQI